MDALSLAVLGLAGLVILSAAVVAGLWLRERGRVRDVSAELDRFRSFAGAETARANAAMADLERFRPIIDIEAMRTALAAQLATDQARWTQTVEAVNQADAALTERRRAIAILEEQENLHELAFYKTRYGLESSAAYEAQLEIVRDRQKQMLQNDTAATCSVPWRVDGSEAKGRKMITKQLKLMLRAFNGECDASIARVTFKNIDTMKQRIERAAEAINKLGETQSCVVTSIYVREKLAELFLMHEYQEKREAEREEQRQIRAQMAEEARADREREKAIKDAEKEEERSEKALAIAREELSHASALERARLEEKIAALERQLEETKRRKAQAELTRSGHVYVLSNIGSFGDGVYKLGMTRRLDPMERVWELSDASVPFDFDVHAMIYTVDAPALENQLHRHFDHLRMNRINLRREFFRATIQEIEAAVRTYAPTAKIEFTLVAHADEYYKSAALLRELRAQQ